MLSLWVVAYVLHVGARMGFAEVGDRQPPQVQTQPETPAPSGIWGHEAELEVNVIFTSWLGTGAALKVASIWARCLGGRIVLWYPQVVSRQLALTAPQVPASFTEERVKSLAVTWAADTEIAVRVCLCRDAQECLLSALASESIVLLGGRPRWWRTREQKLAAFLKSAGHRVLFIPAKEQAPKKSAALERVPIR